MHFKLSGILTPVSHCILPLGEVCSGPSVHRPRYALCVYVCVFLEFEMTEFSWWIHCLDAHAIL